MAAQAGDDDASSVENMYDDLCPPTQQELEMRRVRSLKRKKELAAVSAAAVVDAASPKPVDVVPAASVAHVPSRPRNVHKIKGVAGFSVLSRRPTYEVMVLRVLRERRSSTSASQQEDAFMSRHAVQRQVYERFFLNVNCHTKIMDCGQDQHTEKTVKRELVHRRVHETLEKLVAQNVVQQRKLSYCLV